jgi:hypothetical protein
MKDRYFMTRIKQSQANLLNSEYRTFATAPNSGITAGLAESSYKGITWNSR